MAEPVAEQIASALKTALLAIVEDGGTTYWYTPDAVLISAVDPAIVDGATGVDCFYVLEPRTDSTEEMTSGTIVGRIAFSLLGFKRIGSATSDPWKDSSHLELLYRERMARDVRRMLYTNVQLSGVTWTAASLVVQNVADGSVEADYTITIDAEGCAWSSVLMTFNVLYDVLPVTP